MRYHSHHPIGASWPRNSPRQRLNDRAVLVVHPFGSQAPTVQLKWPAPRGMDTWTAVVVRRVATIEPLWLTRMTYRNASLARFQVRTSLPCDLIAERRVGAAGTMLPYSNDPISQCFLPSWFPSTGRAPAR